MICKFNAVLIKISKAFFTDTEKTILTLLWNHKGSPVAKISLRKKMTVSWNLDIKLYHKAIPIKTDREMNETEYRVQK